MFGSFLYYRYSLSLAMSCTERNLRYCTPVSLSLYLSLAVAYEHLSEVSTITMKTSLCLFAVAKAFVPHKYIFYSLSAAVY